MAPADRLDAVVIGAGPAGLATSRELGRHGVAHTVLERGDAVGTSWRHAYDSLTLHTGKHLSALPGLGHGWGAPTFLPRDQFVDYLERYTARFALPVVTGCEVTRARREGGDWVVETPLGERRARTLVLATGIMANPVRPAIPGEEGFGGRVLHSVDYRRPEPFLGHRVLVVGAGNSASEIASELASAGVRVTLSVRSGANVVPLRLFGVPIQYLAFLVGQLPRPARTAAVRLVQRITELRRGPPVLPRPDVGPLDAIPIIGFHLIDAITAGHVTVRGALVGLEERVARFGDGGPPVTVDDVILATGFRAALQPVRSLVEPDERGFARRRLRVVADHDAGLYVVGHNYDATGALFNIRWDARVAAPLIAERVG